MNIRSNWQVLKQVAIAICLVLILFSSSIFSPNSLAIAAGKSKLEVISDRIDELKPFIDASNWITVGTYIHGPLGQVRQDIGAAIRLQKDQKPAKALSTKFFNDLIAIDVASENKDGDRVINAYEKARKDFDQLVIALKKL